MNTHLTDADVHRYADGELDATTRETHTDHLATCSACANRLAKLEGLLEQAEYLVNGLRVRNRTPVAMRLDRRTPLQNRSREIAWLPMFPGHW